MRLLDKRNILSHLSTHVWRLSAVSYIRCKAFSVAKRKIEASMSRFSHSAYKYDELAMEAVFSLIGRKVAAKSQGHATSCCARGST